MCSAMFKFYTRKTKRGTHSPREQRRRLSCPIEVRYRFYSVEIRSPYRDDSTIFHIVDVYATLVNLVGGTASMDDILHRHRWFERLKIRQVSDRCRSFRK